LSLAYSFDVGGIQPLVDSISDKIIHWL
jgi:hypothetical protein